VHLVLLLFGLDEFLLSKKRLFIMWQVLLCLLLGQSWTYQHLDESLDSPYFNGHLCVCCLGGLKQPRPRPSLLNRSLDHFFLRLLLSLILVYFLSGAHRESLLAIWPRFSNQYGHFLLRVLLCAFNWRLRLLAFFKLLSPLLLSQLGGSRACRLFGWRDSGRDWSFENWFGDWAWLIQVVAIDNSLLDWCEFRGVRLGGRCLLLFLLELLLKLALFKFEHLSGHAIVNRGTEGVLFRWVLGWQLFLGVGGLLHASGHSWLCEVQFCVFMDALLAGDLLLLNFLLVQEHRARFGNRVCLKLIFVRSLSFLV
jgi:hypothetical protein